MNKISPQQQSELNRMYADDFGLFGYQENRLFNKSINVFVTFLAIIFTAKSFLFKIPFTQKYN
jgi:hypothetical protein